MGLDCRATFECNGKSFEPTWFSNFSKVGEIERTLVKFVSNDPNFDIHTQNGMEASFELSAGDSSARWTGFFEEGKSTGVADHHYAEYSGKIVSWPELLNSNFRYSASYSNKSRKAIVERVIKDYRDDLEVHFANDTHSQPVAFLRQLASEGAFDFVKEVLQPVHIWFIEDKKLVVTTKVAYFSRCPNLSEISVDSLKSWGREPTRRPAGQISVQWPGCRGPLQLGDPKDGQREVFLSGCTNPDDAKQALDLLYDHANSERVVWVGLSAELLLDLKIGHSIMIDNPRRRDQSGKYSIIQTEIKVTRRISEGELGEISAWTRFRVVPPQEPFNLGEAKVARQGPSQEDAEIVEVREEDCQAAVIFPYDRHRDRTPLLKVPPNLALQSGKFQLFVNQGVRVESPDRHRPIITQLLHLAPAAQSNPTPGPPAFPDFDPTQPSPPFKIASFLCIERFEGGMSDVYRATDTRDGREVAIKVLKSEYRSDPDAMTAIKDEYQLLSQCFHSNIVKVDGFEKCKDVPYIVMEFLSGHSLNKLIKDDSLGGVDNILRISEEICIAGQYIHSKKIIHRDLKPLNVHVGTDGHIKLFDFGVAKLTSWAKTRTGLAKGSCYYMAPEQFTNDAVNFPADFWAFGVVLYEMLSGGRRPFEGRTINTLWFSIANQAPEYQPLMHSNTPEPIVQLIQRCLEKNPSLRPASFREIQETIREVRKQEKGRAAGKA